MDTVDILSFLFTIARLALGQDYSKEALTPTQSQMLDDLGDFGIIYQDPRSPSRFYPTRLATTLTSDTSALTTSLSTVANPLAQSSPDATVGGGKGYIIIETNFRIYAYTSSPLQIAILQLFSNLKMRFPNLVTGKLTRDSIRRAVAMGITSTQIISYLQTHAHPQMVAKNNPVLPPTVVDQIRLWQIEGERMKATPGFLFKEFGSKAEYDATVAYAEEVGVLVWRNDAKGLFFATRHEQIAAFLKARSKKAEGGAG